MPLRQLFALTGTADEIRAGLAELIDDEALNKRALDRLEAGAAEAYDAASRSSIRAHARPG